MKLATSVKSALNCILKNRKTSGALLLLLMAADWPAARPPDGQPLKLRPLSDLTTRYVIKTNWVLDGLNRAYPVLETNVVGYKPPEPLPPPLPAGFVTGHLTTYPGDQSPRPRNQTLSDTFQTTPWFGTGEPGVMLPIREVIVTMRATAKMPIHDRPPFTRPMRVLFEPGGRVWNVDFQEYVEFVDPDPDAIGHGVILRKTAVFKKK